MAGSVSAPAVRSDGPDRRRGLSLFRNPVTDAVVALVVLLVIFGPKRLPMLGRSLGEGIRGFRESISGRSSHEAQDAYSRRDADSGLARAVADAGTRTRRRGAVATSNPANTRATPRS
jgi:sec-independent protein translocase protein TatA